MSFEKNLEALNGIVAALERGGVPLDESIKLFEEGLALTKSCVRDLNAGKERVEKLKAEMETLFDEGENQ